MKRIIFLTLICLYVTINNDCIKKDCLCTDPNDTTEPTCSNQKAKHCWSDYRAICRKNLNGKCSWHYNYFLKNCLNKSNYCLIGGCNKEICGQNYGDIIFSPCIYKPEFRCYRGAKCEVQDDGFCDWTLTRKLDRCLSFYIY
jgi:hypothetical protein